MTNIQNLFNRFSANTREAIQKAQNLAWELHQQEVKGEHLFLALLTQQGSLSSEILLGSKIQIEKTRNFVYENKAQLTAVKELYLSESIKKAIIKATIISSDYHHKYVGTEHLLLGLLETKDENVFKILNQHSIGYEKIKNQIINILENTSRFPDLEEIFGAIMRKEKLADKKINRKKQPDSILNVFGFELTNQENQKAIDPVIGREEEIQRIIQILCRRNKNNPILLGEAGVGKTAIVEGLAKKILEGQVPEVLQNKRIYTLDVASLIGGAMFRGEFESRFKQVLEEIKDNPNIIIFIDEIHTIIGAGGGGGAMDMANLLKPALARGQVRCIGATTFNEYRKSIENDPALDRRFQAVKIGEPSDDKVIKILSGIRKKYEIFHQVIITDEAIKSAVKLSQMYLPEKFLPDKAIDLLDEAAAKLKTIQQPSRETILINEMTRKLEEISFSKEQAVLDELFDEALQFKEAEKTLLEDLSQLQEKQSGNQVVVGTITDKDIAQVVSQMTQIPIAEITGGEKTKLLNLEKILEKRVVGQKEAIQKVAQAIRRARTGVRNQNQPIGSFMFLGASGVGKTELAKTLAESLFGHDALIRIDMSEFAEGFNISKLIGAPAGYVGYKEGGKLSEAVKHKPYSVVLLDEIEKAHPDVFNLLLQILDEGHLTDASGKRIDFKNTVIIMTSNIGIDSFNHQAEVGFNSQVDKSKIEFDELKQHIQEELKEYFRPEFLNRLDQSIIFNSLNLENMKKIVKLKIEQLNSRIADKNIKLIPSAEAVKFFAEKDFDANHGARSINRNVSEIEDLLAEGLLQDKFIDGDSIKIEVVKDKIILKK